MVKFSVIGYFCHRLETIKKFCHRLETIKFFVRGNSAHSEIQHKFSTSSDNQAASSAQVRALPVP